LVLHYNGEPDRHAFRDRRCFYYLGQFTEACPGPVVAVLGCEFLPLPCQCVIDTYIFFSITLTPNEVKVLETVLFQIIYVVIKADILQTLPKITSHLSSS
jgi:hypothetical protein